MEDVFEHAALPPTYLATAREETNMFSDSKRGGLGYLVVFTHQALELL